MKSITANYPPLKSSLKYRMSLFLSGSHDQPSDPTENYASVTLICLHLILYKNKNSKSALILFKLSLLSPLYTYYLFLLFIFFFFLCFYLNLESRLLSSNLFSIFSRLSLQLTSVNTAPQQV